MDVNTWVNEPATLPLAFSKRPVPPPAPAGRQSKREELEERYIRLEAELARYRYPVQPD